MLIVRNNNSRGNQKLSFNQYLTWTAGNIVLSLSLPKVLNADRYWILAKYKFFTKTGRFNTAHIGNSRAS